MTVINKPITSEILVAYAQCPRKAYLLLCTEEKGIPHEYEHILEQKRQANQRKHLNILGQKNHDVQPYNLEILGGKHEFLINATLEANGLVAECAILSKVKTRSALGRYSYEPTIFVGTYSLNKEQKLELLFVGHVLGKVQNKRPISGRIIGLDEKSYKVKLENSSKTLIPLLEPLQEWATDASPEPPPLILNKHCSTCQFQSLCRAKAEQEDNLSLLNGISTSKVINKYEKKGIFTVKQLSYTFKPRRRRKRTKNSPSTTYKPELQALALREGKVYLQESPKLVRQPTELFLDIEGIPDRQFYYLIGLLVCEGSMTSYYSFWAATSENEGQMWQQFLEKVNQYAEAPIYHYGSYELRAVVSLTKRYNTNEDGLKMRLVNVNKYIYGKIYFPVYSNRLKELGMFIGAKWTSPDASGLQTLVWRHYWEETQNVEYRDLLFTYNREDCQALRLLTDELSRIKHSADILVKVDFANQPKRQATEVGKEIHSQFEEILKFAHANYDKKKISFQKDKKEENREKKKRGSKKGYQGQRKVRPRPTKIKQVSPREFCPVHKGQLLQPTEQISKRLIIDLVFTKNGIKKTITEYVGVQGYCRKCYKFYTPPDINKHSVNQLYGYNFKAWLVYARIALRLSYGNIAQLLEVQFHEKLKSQEISRYVKEFASYYVKTEEGIAQRLLENPFIHIDETDVSIRGVNQYVWVFTDGKHVIFKLRETREATIVHEFLADYSGIIISDFYSGYDSVQCKQQKCWIHLIRNLNDDLWAAPFDTEFEIFVLEVKNLIIPIMEAVHKYGLKKRHLNKFKKSVDKFYDSVITDKYYKSELTLKYQNRFIRYRESLFTFLEQDGIPWHNNMAERTLRHVAMQGRLSGYFHETVMPSYLILLGIRQTCRFQDKSFFKFLFSRETDMT